MSDIQPNGQLGFYFIHGMPNLKFMIKSRSKRYLELKEAERTGEINAMFPKTPMARAATGITQKELNEMTWQFNEKGELKTKDQEVALAGLNASRNFNHISKNMTEIDPYSLPLPKDRIKDDPVVAARIKVAMVDENGFALSTAEAIARQTNPLSKPEKKEEDLAEAS